MPDANESRAEIEPSPGNRAPTFGERTVRLWFNPSGNREVAKIKEYTAALIDLCDAMRGPRSATESGRERSRLASLAVTAYEEAAMWAVKAATTGYQ